MSYILCSLILLACITYGPLKRYVHKWNELKPIPGMPGAYPIIGHALQFKANAGGKVGICPVEIVIKGFYTQKRRIYFDIVHTNVK